MATAAVIGASVGVGALTAGGFAAAAAAAAAGAADSAAPVVTAAAGAAVGVAAVAEEACGADVLPLAAVPLAVVLVLWMSCGSAGGMGLPSFVCSFTTCTRLETRAQFWSLLVKMFPQVSPSRKKLSFY